MTYLDRILDAHRRAAADDVRSLADLARAASESGPTRGFRAALERAEGLGVIAEIKRRSPSKGDLDANLEPGEVAREYVRGGATCLSVLTDHEFFGGTADDLSTARSAVDVPVLRKDFTVCPADVYDARIMGADAVLLIVAALDEDELASLHNLATGLGLDALVEAHDETEVARALDVGATLIGVNQRDLVTFEVDTQRAVRVARFIPTGVVRVAESGIRGPEHARALYAAGYQAVLVGESLVTSGDRAAAVRDLRGENR